MNFYFAYPVVVLALFVLLAYGHRYINKKSDPEPFFTSQMFRQCFLYAAISSAMTSFLFTTFSDNIQSFVCTVFDLPFERTKETVEVYTDEPTF